MRWLLRFSIIPLVSLSSVDAQPATPAQSVPLPQAIYSPQPVFRSEWAKQGLTGKGRIRIAVHDTLELAQRFAQVALQVQQGRQFEAVQRVARR